MNTLKVKRLHPDAKLPTKAHATDAGFDLFALETVEVDPRYTDKLRTGISVEIPKGYVGVIHARSSWYSIGARIDGIIDSDYRGEVMIMFGNDTREYWRINAGDKVAQMLLLPVPEFEVVEVPDGAELSETSRGSGGFGSSGR